MTPGSAVRFSIVFTDKDDVGVQLDKEFWKTKRGDVDRDEEGDEL